MSSFRYGIVDLTFDHREVREPLIFNGCKGWTSTVRLNTWQVGHSGVESLSSWVLGEGTAGFSLVGILNMLKQREVSDRGDITTAQEILFAKKHDNFFHAV